MSNKIRYKTVKRWYLEMDERPAYPNFTFREGIEIKPFLGSVDEYRKLNKLVGGDLGWIDRQIIPTDQLEHIINEQGTEIFLLFFQNKLAGFCELVEVKPRIIELKYFGLVPEMRGKGLGKPFLNWTIDKAMQRIPERFILNTCEIDHPGALPMYLKAGFKIIEERMEEQAEIIK